MRLLFPAKKHRLFIVLNDIAKNNKTVMYCVDMLIVSSTTQSEFNDYFTSQHDFGIFTWKADYWPFVLGGLFIGVVLWIKGGLMGLPGQLMRLIKGSGTGTASNKN